MVGPDPFVPLGFDAWRSAIVGPLRLEVLSPEHAVVDYEAVRASGAEIAEAYGPENWWSADLTYEQNLADLARHESEFAAGEAFAYVMFSLASAEYVGCVYIRPAPDALRHRFQARVYFWLAASQRTVTDAQAFRALSGWLRDTWPFEAVVFPGRSIGWEAYRALSMQAPDVDPSGAQTSISPLPAPDAVVADLRARGIELPSGPVRIDAYGDSAALSASLLALVAGRKRAGTSLRWAFDVDGVQLPRVGDIEIVVDHRRHPALITRITRVQVVPYREVTAEYAAIEGEGDGSLASWREAHWAFFSRECARIGRVPSEEMPVVCSVFEVVRVVDVQVRDHLVSPIDGV